MNELDSYLEMLYEEGDDPKIQGTARILQLCERVGFLEQLVQNQTVMGALTRVLQEEYKRSIELSFNIVRIFLAFSNFIEMHGILATYRVGLLTMKVIDFEIRRIQHRQEEHKAREAQQEAALQRQQRDHNFPQLLEAHKRNQELELAKSRRFEKRQDKLLFVSFCVLMNLAEDVAVERKMVKKNVIEMLCAMLTRTGADLLTLTVTFLKKLSVFEENKAMLSPMLPSLVRLLASKSDVLMTITLRLLFNLSFDQSMREKMLREGLLPKLVQLLKSNTKLRGRTLKLLYHLSAEDRCKSMFTFTEDGIVIILGLIINFPRNSLAQELAALAINLSHNHRNAERMAQDGNLSHLMIRLQETKDPLLMKIIRNISNWTFNIQAASPDSTNEYRYRGLWSPHVKSMMQLAKVSDNSDLLVELLGTLANLTAMDLPSRNWITLFQECEFASYMCRWLVPGISQNDMVLEVLMFMAQVANDKSSSVFLASSTLVALAEQTWRDKTDDTEIVLQSLYLFYLFFQWKETREEAFRGTRVVLLMIEALKHRDEAVQQWADRCLQVLVEADGDTLGDLGERIKWHRFEAYNRQWVRLLGDESWEERQTDTSIRRMIHSPSSDDDRDLHIPSNWDWRTAMDRESYDSTDRHTSAMHPDLAMFKSQLGLHSMPMSNRMLDNDRDWLINW